MVYTWTKNNSIFMMGFCIERKAVKASRYLLNNLRIKSKII